MQHGFVDAAARRLGPRRRTAPSAGARPAVGRALLLARRRATTSASTPARAWRTSCLCSWTSRSPPGAAGSRSDCRLHAWPIRPIPLWYKDAVIYQAHVRAFFDSNERRRRRLRGPDPEARLPRRASASTASGCCPSTRRRCEDDGYDIADYENIHPSYGTLDGLRPLHRRGAPPRSSASSPSWSSTTPRTSTRGSRRARRAPAGSPERDFYVWSDTNQKYQGVRIIFTDTEKSNWTLGRHRQGRTTGTGSSTTSRT